jgi:hypothetical protein
MRLLISAAAALAMLAIPATAQAAGWVDDPDVPNCSILGKLSDTNAPDCEWVAVTGKSIVASQFGQFECHCGYVYWRPDEDGGSWCYKP